MSRLSRLLCASVLAICAFLALPDARVPAIAGAPQMRVLHNGQAVHLLAPGADFSVVSSGLGASRATYCLGLISVQDRYGLPVNLGAFKPAADGLMVVSARVPVSVFPAEPPGSFLLFAGRCTTVAPDGLFAIVTITILPAMG